MKLIYSTLLAIICAPFVTYAQPYGNEWINYNQQYAQTTVTEEGIYRIGYEQLFSIYPSIANIPITHLQVFSRGEEQPIDVQSADAVFNTGDYISFYGKPNDGFLDKELYDITPATHTNPYYSLFTDTATYYITWSNAPSTKHFTTAPTITATSIAPTGYTAVAAKNFTDAYYDGEIQAEYATLSEYTAGEGWLGSLFGLGQSQIHTIPTPLAITASTCTIQLAVMGRSNAMSNSGKNHHLQVEISTNGSTYTLLADTVFTGYQFTQIDLPVSTNLLGNTQTYFRFSSVNDLGAVSDFMAPAYLRISYPHALDAQNSNLLHISSLNTAAAAPLNISNFSGNNPVLYDFTNRKRYVANAADFVLVDAGEKELLLCDSANFKAAMVQAVQFTPITLTTAYDYLIITADKLLPAAQQYAQYRQSTGFTPLAITTEQLYAQFTYGIHHPIAIRRFVHYLLNQLPQKPTYLVLLGKGYETDYLRKGKLNTDLVPAMGVPSSDHLFTSGLAGTNWEPALATGRVAVRTNNEALAYLDKVKNYELTGNKLWRKHFLHLGGGATPGEVVLFGNILAQQGKFASDTSLGARITPFTRNVNAPNASDFKQKIINTINEGVGMVNYFGHGGPLMTQINMGAPEEYNNAGRLPIMLLNGCDGGNANIDSSMGEHFMRYPNMGFVGWIGTTGVGYSGFLSEFSNRLHSNTFAKQYGKSISQLLQTTVKEYQQPNSFLNRVHARQYLFQGDPALTFYAPTLPDYEITSSDIYLSPQTVSTNTDSFAVNIIVKNNGKAILDSLSVSIKRTLPDNSTITYPEKKFKSVFYSDTLVYYIKSEGAEAKGINKFEINLNPLKAISELTYTNNSTTIEQTITANSLSLLFPRSDAIINTDTLRLVAQADNLLLQNGQYVFELDTVPDFSSPFKKSSGTVTSNALVTWLPNILPTANTVYFWRAKLVDAPNWENARFTYTPNYSDGFNQQHPNQFKTITTKNIAIDGINGAFNFVDNAINLTLRTKGDNEPTGAKREIRINTSQPVFANNEFSGVRVLAFHPVSLARFSYPSNFNLAANTPDYPFEIYRYSGVFNFNTASATDRDSLVQHLMRIPANYEVILYNGRTSSIPAFSEALYQQIEQLGATKIRSIAQGEPYILLGKKAAPNADVIELTADKNSAIPTTEQVLFAEKQYIGKWNTGTITSARIGPAKNWEKLYYQFTKAGNDAVQLRLLGFRTDGSDTLLLANCAPDSVDLKTLIPPTINYVKLQAAVTDSTENTAAQLKFWRITYSGISETTVLVDSSYRFYADKLQEGDSLHLQFKIANLTDYSSDSVMVIYKAVNNNRVEQVLSSTKVAPLAARQQVPLSATLPTTGLIGNYTLKAVIAPTDLYPQNNTLSLATTIINDTRKPIVDVLIDGKKILNNDIVSPKPLISITSTDENKYLKLHDTALVKFYLKHPGATDFTPINYTTPGVQTTQQKGNSGLAILYQPVQPLTDGTYTLKVAATDASGNKSATDYEIAFEVINESSITRFLPYPNPFTTRMRFVYTLTGMAAPDQLKIQIYTITGKVVREVLLPEFGAMRIGNNVSDFVWDGTDQFGDRLANGVYFYRVIAKLNGQPIKQRTTSADNLFEKGWGKIYLMR